MKYQIKNVIGTTLKKLAGPLIGVVIGLAIGIFGSKMGGGFFSDVIPTQDSVIVSCDTMMVDSLQNDSTFILNGDTIQIIMADTTK